MHYLNILIRVCIVLVICGCAQKPSLSGGHIAQGKMIERIFALQNVNVIPITPGEKVLPNVTVIIKNDRIEAVNAPIPRGAQVINASGKWLIPGLIDMHVHVPTDIHFGRPVPTQAASVFFDTQDNMTPYIANGVTTILELTGKAEHFAQRNEIASGDVIGPRMAIAALINGGEGSGRIVNNASDGRQAVRSAKAEGYEFIKVYSALNQETFAAIIDEGHKQGLKVIGHIPNAFKGELKKAFVPHFGMVAHAEEFSKQSTQFNEVEADRFAHLMKENNTWLSPTLTTMECILDQARSLDKLRVSAKMQYVHPLLQSKWLTSNNYNRNSSPEFIARLEKMLRFHILLVRACKSAGVPLVAGTDTGASGVFAGFAMHDELELLVAAGLTPLEAISSATLLSAKWLGIDSLVGSIQAGKRADLILLNSNPLSDIKNTRDISGVFVNGRWVPGSILDSMLKDLGKRNNAGKEYYDWKKVTGR